MSGMVRTQTAPRSISQAADANAAPQAACARGGSCATSLYALLARQPPLAPWRAACLPGAAAQPRRATLQPRSSHFQSPEDVRNALKLLEAASVDDEELVDQWRGVLRAAENNGKGLYVTF